MAAVKDCPATRDALIAGKVSLAQAAQITLVPEDETELLEIAMRSSLGALREEARTRWLAAIPPDTLHARRREAREFVHWKNRLGMTCFRGALPPEVGVPFAKRMDAETDRVWRAARRDGREVTRVQCAADAFERLVNGRGKRAGRAVDMVIVTDLRAYRRGHAHPGEVAHIIGGGPIPVSIARELAKDGFLKVVLHDGVQIHTVKHFGRHRPAELETALMLGAPPGFEGVSCAELGCDRKLGLQWDHEDPVANVAPRVRRIFSPCAARTTVRRRNATVPPAGCGGSRRNRYGRSRSATAHTAMPSARPIAPMPSPRFGLIDTKVLRAEDGHRGCGPWRRGAARGAAPRR